MVIPCLLSPDWLSVFYRAMRRNIHGEKSLKRSRFSQERVAKVRNLPGIGALAAP
jgi:hypothetical protein